MIAIIPLLVMLFAHTVADFMFQTDKMAINKSSSNSWLLKHTITYTLVLGALMSGFAFYKVGLGLLIFTGLLGQFLFVNFVAHTVTDFITSRITSYYWKKEKRHEFFVTIGFDQLAHIAVLVLSYAYILGPFVFILV